MKHALPVGVSLLYLLYCQHHNTYGNSDVSDLSTTSIVVNNHSFLSLMLHVTRPLSKRPDPTKGPHLDPNTNLTL